MTTVTEPNPPVFYSLPAEDLTAGMSTNDGQDILHVDTVGGLVIYDVYTPADDPDVDHDRQCAPEARMRPVGQRVELAVFDDTAINATAHDHAAQTVISTQAPATHATGQ